MSRLDYDGISKGEMLPVLDLDALLDVQIARVAAIQSRGATMCPGTPKVRTAGA